MIEGKPGQKFMHFKLRGHDQTATFTPYGQYTMNNKPLADLMVKHSLNRMYEVNLFGSGYPISPPKDYPHMMAEINFTVIYDSTHVDPHSYDSDEYDLEYYEIE